MVDFYGKLVGKYTVRPMDPSWVMKGFIAGLIEGKPMVKFALNQGLSFRGNTLRGVG